MRETNQPNAALVNTEVEPLPMVNTGQTPMVPSNDIGRFIELLKSSTTPLALKINFPVMLTLLNQIYITYSININGNINMIKLSNDAPALDDETIIRIPKLIQLLTKSLHENVVKTSEWVNQYQIMVLRSLEEIGIARKNLITTNFSIQEVHQPQTQIEDTETESPLVVDAAPFRYWKETPYTKEIHAKLPNKETAIQDRISIQILLSFIYSKYKPLKNFDDSILAAAGLYIKYAGKKGISDYICDRAILRHVNLEKRQAIYNFIQQTPGLLDRIEKDAELKNAYDIFLKNKDHLPYLKCLNEDNKDKAIEVLSDVERERDDVVRPALEAYIAHMRMTNGKFSINELENTFYNYSAKEADLHVYINKKQLISHGKSYLKKFPKGYEQYLVLMLENAGFANLQGSDEYELYMKLKKYVEAHQDEIAETLAGLSHRQQQTYLKRAYVGQPQEDGDAETSSNNPKKTRICDQDTSNVTITTTTTSNTISPTDDLSTESVAGIAVTSSSLATYPGALVNNLNPQAQDKEIQQQAAEWVPKK